MRLVVHPVAALELDAALQWSKATFGDRTAARLERRFEQAGQMLLREPVLDSQQAGQIRKRVMRKFPYTLAYRVEGDLVRVVTLAHQSRKPGYWEGR